MTATPDPALAIGASMERERIKAIVELPEAERREDAALKLALTTSMSPLEVAGVLATLPKASVIPTEGRSQHSPFGITFDRVDDPRSAAVLTPEQVAARANAEPGL